MSDCADQLDRLNQHFPNLVTSASLEGVECWRNCEINMQDSSKADRDGDGTEEIREVAQQLVKTEDLEDVLEILKVKHGVELNLPQLVELIGKEPYLNVLRKEASLMVDKGLTYEEISIAWNDLGRPALGASKWEAKAISLLVE